MWSAMALGARDDHGHRQLLQWFSRELDAVGPSGRTVPYSRGIRSHQATAPAAAALVDCLNHQGLPYN